MDRKVEELLFYSEKPKGTTQHRQNHMKMDL
jgi:hypothetical protein